MFGLIGDILSIPQKLVETVDDVFLDGLVTGDRRKKEVVDYIERLVNSGYSVEQAKQMAIARFS